MKIGVDLDHTVYGFPEFFRAFIPAMVAAGHEVYCTSNHARGRWENRDRSILQSMGIDPDLINPQYLPDKPVNGPDRHWVHKAPVADQMDVVFDDHAKRIQPHTNTPVFGVPGKFASDRGHLRR